MGADLTFAALEPEFSWHDTGRLNIVYEAVDRHVEEGGKAAAKALFFTNGQRQETFTFGQLKDYSSKFANVLKKHGVGRRDRVAVFMPACPELYISFLGILKAGAVAVPIFEGFMEEAVRERLLSAGVVAVVTTPELRARFNRQKCPTLRHVFVVGGCGCLAKGDIQWHNEMTEASREFTPVCVHRQDPMFIFFASAAHGRQKEIIHVHNDMIGYLATGRLVHDLKPGDIYWCTADPGWVTGIVCGFLTPWLFGVPIVVKGGRINVKDWYETLAKYKVTVWYSAPAAFGLMMEKCDTGVTGKMDPLRGEIVKAYITLSKDFDWTGDLCDDIRNFVKQGLAAHAAPREIEVRINIPKTKEGQVDRCVLKEWALGLEE